MPYKDPQKAKESARRRYELNIERRKLCGKNYYINNRDKVLAQHSEKKEELRDKCVEWRKNNKDKIKEYKDKNYDKFREQERVLRKKDIHNLKDWYVVNIISKQTKAPTDEIKKNPELIEEFKNLIRVKRSLKIFKKNINQKNKQ